MEDLKKSLIDFVRKIKNSDYRKRRLLEDLDYTIHQMYSIPGPVYDRVGGTTNVKPDRIIMLLDKKDRIERALKKIEEEKEIFNSFLSSLTEKQKEVFDWYYLQNEKTFRISKYMNISFQAVEQYKLSIIKKWGQKKFFFHKTNIGLVYFHMKIWMLLKTLIKN